MHDLIDLKEEINEAIERKHNEDRVTLLVVHDSSMTYAHFPAGDYTSALEYSLKHAHNFCGKFVIEPTKVRASEAEEKLADRW